MDDVDIIDKFRLPRFLILNLCGELRVHLEHLTGRSHAIPQSLQVMVALRFYASGNFQTVNGDVHGISKASVSRIVNTVTSALVTLSPNYVRFPRDDRSINDTILGFSRISNFPYVIGAIDGTHIPIKAPKDNHVPAPRPQNPRGNRFIPPDNCVYQGPNNDGMEVRRRLIHIRY